MLKYFIGLTANQQVLFILKSRNTCDAKFPAFFQSSSTMSLNDRSSRISFALVLSKPAVSAIFSKLIHVANVFAFDEVSSIN